jgi:hypothetical protein
MRASTLPAHAQSNNNVQFCRQNGRNLSRKAKKKGAELNSNKSARKFLYDLPKYQG